MPWASNFFGATPLGLLYRRRVLFEMRVSEARRAQYLILDAGAGWRPIFYGTVIRADFPKVELMEHKMCLIEASVSAATHFLICVMNGASFFDRVLSRMYSAFFGVNTSFEPNRTFRKLARLPGLRLGRFRGAQSCRVGPWPFCDAHVFPGWGLAFLWLACLFALGSVFREIVSPNAEIWQRFAVVNGCWASFLSNRSILAT